MTDYIVLIRQILLKDGKVHIKVKPNAKKTEIIAFDNGVFTISIDEKPENNKANIELLKFLNKLTKLKLRIAIGKTSKNKLIVIDK